MTTSNVPAFLVPNIVGDNISLSGTPANSDAAGSPYNIIVTADDGYDSTNFTFPLTVVSLNNAPHVVNPAGSLSRIAGSTFYHDCLGSPVFIYDVSAVFEDADGDSFTMTVDHPATTGTLPSWITFNGIEFTINPSEVGLFNFDIIATDTFGESTTDPFVVEIKNTHPSVINNPLDSTMFNGTAYSRTIDYLTVFYDPDVINGYQNFSFLIHDVPSFLVSTTSGTDVTISGSPSTGDVGTYTLLLTAADGYAQKFASFDIVVEINSPPVASNVTDITVKAQGTTVFDFTNFQISDPDSDVFYDSLWFANGTSQSDVNWIAFNSGDK